MGVLDCVKLTPLMERTAGSPEIVIGLIDGPVLTNHPDLAGVSIRTMSGSFSSACARSDSAACQHGTFVAGILSARRGSSAPAICPNCTLLVRPIFTEIASNGEPPSANPEALADAIFDCIRAGVHMLNISAAIAQPSSRCERALDEALNHALQSGVIVVVAAGNQGTLASTAITRHPWTIPIAAYDALGRPMVQSNLGSSIGRRGVGAPGDRIVSIGVRGDPIILGGTSAAAPFVTGAIALLWSEFRDASAAALKLAVTQVSGRRNSVVPPLLNAWAAYQHLSRE